MKNMNPTQKGCLGCLGVFILLVVIFSIQSAFTPDQPKTGLSMGEKGIVICGNEPTVFLAIDISSQDAFTKAAIAKDYIGMQRLVSTGRVFEVPANTRVLVIDRKTFIRQVRVLEGPQAGRAGWLPMEWIKESN